jgi:hypothetical protein
VAKCEAAPLHAIEEMNAPFLFFGNLGGTGSNVASMKILDFAFFDSLAQSLIIVIGLLLTEKRHRPYPTVQYRYL